MSCILASVDFSDSTPGVIDSAVRMAATFGLPLVICHVTEPIPQFVGGDAAFQTVQVPVPIDVEPQRARVAELAEQTKARHEDTHGVMRMGPAVDEIIQTAREQGAEYIVMGSHGHGALYHLLVGSVVTGVLKHAGIPVVITPPASGKR